MKKQAKTEVEPSLEDRIAEECLTPIWRGIDADYKRRYAMTIWSQFEQAIKSAAYTDNLATFLESMLRKVGGARIAAQDAPVVTRFIVTAEPIETLVG